MTHNAEKGVCDGCQKRPCVCETVVLPTAENDAPTMTQAECRCPDDCDCDGRFACEAQAGNTTHRCQLVVGHPGWHVADNHRWSPAPIPPAKTEGDQ